MLPNGKIVTVQPMTGQSGASPYTMILPNGKLIFIDNYSFVWTNCVINSEKMEHFRKYKYEFVANLSDVTGIWPLLTEYMEALNAQMYDMLFVLPNRYW
jgi:hypothetical protein